MAGAPIVHLCPLHPSSLTSLVDSRNTAPINICDKDQATPTPRQLNKACQTNPEIIINQTKPDQD